MRTRLLVGNWKLHKTPPEAAAFVGRLSKLVRDIAPIEVVLAPPFTALDAVARALPPQAPFALAGQNLYWEDAGAFTGEVSAPMLKALGCRYVILGHSERRKLFGETDETVNKKIRAALRHGLGPIICLGESLADRDAGRAEGVVRSQLDACLAGFAKEEVARMALAYEPVWAIGTGRAATSAQAEAIHSLLRRELANGWGTDTAEGLRILYGGSVTPENLVGFLGALQVDGALVGGACLDPQLFAKMIELTRGPTS